jgi:branched-chain amino acid aminotransferase
MSASIFINGKFVDAARAKISVFDRSFLYGDAAFETMRGYAGVIFRLDAHIKRLLGALKILKIKHAYSAKYLKDTVNAALRVNGLKSAYVRLVVTRGEGRFGIGHKDIFKPNMVVFAKDFEGYPERMFRDGISAAITGVTNEYSPLSGIKSANYLNLIMSRFDAKGAGFDEAILVNTKGHITEAATSNIFAIKAGALITPALNYGVLPGVTRGVVIEIAKSLKIPVKERVLTPSELIRADEVFLTNSLAEVLPVTKIDGKSIGKNRFGHAGPVDHAGRVGQLTKLLHISYQKLVIREALAAL